MAEDEDQNAKNAESKEDKASRMNSAKAFYRAMYAGAEPDPEEFGIDLGASKQAGGGGGGDDSATQAAVLHLQDQLKDSEAKATEYENLYKRIIADFDNYKKRMDRERDEMQQIGMQKALEAILPGLDDLDMAQSKLTETTEPKVMLQSFKMIVSRFNRCLELVGIKQMEAIGELFDPRLHEPIQEVPTAEFPEGHVMQQLRPGYIMGEKVLRPVLVNVATAPLDGPGYQPPAAPAEGSAPAESPASAATESAPAGSSQPEPATVEAPAENPAQQKMHVTEEDVIAASQIPAEIKADFDMIDAADFEIDTGDSSDSVQTGDTIPKVDRKASAAEQFSTQDIPLKEFKASMAGDAAEPGSGDTDKKKKKEKAVGEAVASSEEA